MARKSSRRTSPVADPDKGIRNAIKQSLALLVDRKYQDFNRILSDTEGLCATWNFKVTVDKSAAEPSVEAHTKGNYKPFKDSVKLLVSDPNQATFEEIESASNGEAQEEDVVET